VQVKTCGKTIVPLKRAHELCIAIPASFVSDVPHLREKTFRIGLVGRAAAIFRVDEVLVFPDMPKTDQSRDINLICTILAYMETPQYLRKRLFKIQPELQYAGVLPPLRTPHHPLADRIQDLKVDELREGAVIGQSKEGSLIDVGVEQPALVAGVKMSTNTRVTVKIKSLEKQPKAVLADRKEIKQYWGYKVTISDTPFGHMLKKRQFDLIVATSRKGKPIDAVLNELIKSSKQSLKILLAFGAPTQGLFEIAAQERLKLEDLANFIVNTIPSQGTETVRTEEAVHASLAILNALEGLD
jgi:predicted SPOUT superfamily RNA methylase MTH1